MTIEVAVIGPHGETFLVEEEDGTYKLEGDAPNRAAVIMLAMGVLENVTEEERQEFGLEDVWL